MQPVRTQSIPDYFAGKCVLVTGATGFLGKVLVEKLLRSCPAIGNIYVLIRNKKRKSPQERWDNIIESNLFDSLKATNGLALNKVIVVESDVGELGLGLSAKNREELINNVSFVYHSAATVRFDESFKTAVILNLRGTREMCSLVLEMKKLLCFLHLSTTYCQIGTKVLEEKLFPARGNPYEAIEIAERMDGEILKSIVPKYIEGFPNTYTFTKSLAETLVKDMCEGRVPTIVLRPSIVIPALIDPIPGFVDNFHGPVGICMAAGKGFIRTILCRTDIMLDSCPVDAVIRGIIKATWNQPFIKNNEVAVYNSTNTNIYKTTTGEQMYHKEVLYSYKKFYKPALEYNIIYTTLYSIFWMRLYWYQFLPGCFVDGILKLFGKQTLVLKNLAKITVTYLSTIYFYNKNWNFVNKNFLGLDNYLLKEDEDNFADCMHLYDQEKLYLDILVSLGKLLNEEDLDYNYKLSKRNDKIYFVWNNVWRIIFAYAFYSYILLPMYYKSVEYLTSL